MNHTVSGFDTKVIEKLPFAIKCLGANPALPAANIADAQ
jgi:hypothetical protein